jgi:hypothetical protein
MVHRPDDRRNRRHFEGPPAKNTVARVSARRDFFVYIDEFQSFTTLALANMLTAGDNYCYNKSLNVPCHCEMGRLAMERTL